MSSRDESVKVCDSEIKQLAKLADCWDEIDSVLSKYVSILKKIEEEAVQSGKIHDAIDNLRFYAETYQKYGVGLGAMTSGMAEKLVSKVEDVDLKLYNEV